METSQETDENGVARIEYYNGDDAISVRLQAEDITSEGLMGGGTTIYRVKKASSTKSRLKNVIYFPNKASQFEFSRQRWVSPGRTLGAVAKRNDVRMDSTSYLH